MLSDLAQIEIVESQPHRRIHTGRLRPLAVARPAVLIEHGAMRSRSWSRRSGRSLCRASGPAEATPSNRTPAQPRTSRFEFTKPSVQDAVTRIISYIYPLKIESCQESDATASSSPLNVRRFWVKPAQKAAINSGLSGQVFVISRCQPNEELCRLNTVLKIKTVDRIDQTV
jgi:hypothetical protein